MKQEFPLMLGAVSAVSVVMALGFGEQAAAQGSGKQAYEQVCSRCHDSGMMGAPVLGSKSAWSSRLAKGKKALYQSAIGGIGAMPPKGGSNLPSSEVEAAVDYMIAQASGGGGGGGGGGGQQASGGGGGGGGMPSAAMLLKAPVSGLQIEPLGKTIKNPVGGSKSAIASGEALFLSMGCVGCHAPDAGGGMGPALTDVAWIYGDQPSDIYLTISHGRPNGMPAYGNALPPKSIWNLVAYVKTLER